MNELYPQIHEMVIAKKPLTDSGTVDLKVPRDRGGGNLVVRQRHEC